MDRPDTDWLLTEARKLSARKDENSVRALAWNLSVAFSRWAEETGQRQAEQARQRQQEIQDFLSQAGKP